MMFERALSPMQRLRRALRAFLELSACRVFTQAQQILAALLLAALGAAGALLAAARVPGTVTLLPPVAERVAPDYSVYRIEFEHHGAVSWCHIVIYAEAGKWTVKC